MALIYRSLLEIEDPEGNFVDRAPEHVRDWLRWKLRADSLELDEEGLTRFEPDGIEVNVRAGADDACAVARIEVFEGRRDDGVEVKTTVTAIRDEDASWAWVDLERWTPDATAAAWLPSPPGIVSTVLLKEKASRGNLELTRDEAYVEGDAGRLVAELVLDESRAVPLIVVSYSEREANGTQAARDRGRALARRLAGVASTYVLGAGAVTAFSRSMHDAVGEGMDVHSGAVRVYLPGAGGALDSRTRHRFVPFWKLEGRRPDLPALMLGPSLLQRSAESPPPAAWRASARALLTPSGGKELEDLLVIADSEIADLNRANDDLRAAASQLRESLDAERQDTEDLVRHNDDLSRRVRFLREQLRGAGVGLDESPVEAERFEPILCMEVVEHVRAGLDMVEIPSAVDEGTEALDAHGDESWAGKAWAAFQALDNYARLKRSGDFDGGFTTYCEQAAGDFVIPSGWVAHSESARTMETPKFARLRVRPVSTDVAPEGEILMEEHIRIERGGSPSPRIHYYDDTRGPTGKVHVGWFGDHLDSWAKS